MNFRANISKGTFCLPDCKKAPRDGSGAREFDRAREALAAGFRPCKTCTPLLTGIADPPWLVPVLLA